uniref:Uncharacterized protein n=1 Tax=Knipowitschia caucasica TaxID=637954 RepID=A0AAV2M653_KNICA
MLETVGVRDDERKLQPTIKIRTEVSACNVPQRDARYRHMGRAPGTKQKRRRLLYMLSMEESEHTEGGHQQKNRVCLHLTLCLRSDTTGSVSTDGRSREKEDCYQGDGRMLL